MEQIKSVEIDGEKIHLKKDFLGWRIVSPIKNDDGTYNWKNIILGNKRTMIFLVVWILIMAFIFYGVNEMISSCRDMADNPCKYFKMDCSIISNDYNISLPLISGGDENGKRT